MNTTEPFCRLVRDGQTATLFLLGNAIIDPTSRWGTLAVLGAILVGIPVYYLTVGRRERVRT